MKNKNFREMRREEKRRAFEMKQARKEAARAKLRAERQAKQLEQKEKALEENPRPDTFVGRLEFVRRGGIVYIDSKFLKDNIIVPTPYLSGAQEGDKVVVKLLYPERVYARKKATGAMPEGEVIDVLGKDGDNDTEMHAILAEYGLPYSYPEDIAQAAEKIDAGITPEEVKKRRDMRDVLTLTIDPRDAKDFDDAISFRVLENGLYEVGVHIADVTHYVQPNTIIDEEGYKRGTSVYLVDRTIPMLPEHLSNGICSLRPNEEKLTYSVVFEMDEDAVVKKYDICRTVICSNRRYCYEEAQAIIEEKSDTGDIGDRKKTVTGIEAALEEALWKLDTLAKKLREKRFEKGAIAFDREEVKFEIDETGKPISVYFKTSEDANKLIEEFMLLANRTVATFVGREQKKAFVYRVHDLPDPDKLKNLSTFIKRFGYNLKTSSTRKETVSKNINSLLNSVQGKTEQNLIETVAVRAMAKAVYTTDNIGHYGLAFPYYTHFTSPIRRYPDMMVHRLLASYAAGKAGPDESALEDKCKHCSNREQLAASAERASIKYKQVEFMQDHLGKEYEGVISGVTEWGVYVEITENKCEGLVPIRDLQPQDYYNYYDKEFCVRGERTGKTFQLGDVVWVRVERADLQKRQLDFSLVERPQGAEK